MAPLDRPSSVFPHAADRLSVREKSDRELCREVHLNLAYQWFCRLKLTDAVVPYHSSMTGDRDHFGESVFTEIFEHLIHHWKAAGYIRGQRIVADACQPGWKAMQQWTRWESVRTATLMPARLLKQYGHRYHDFREGATE